MCGRSALARLGGGVQRAAVVAGVAVDVMASWMSLPAHAADPYPTREERRALAGAGGITERQVDYWLGNARKRVWKVGVRVRAGRS